MRCSKAMICLVASVAVVIVVVLLLVMRRSKKPSPKVEDLKPE